MISPAHFRQIGDVVITAFGLRLHAYTHLRVLLVCIHTTLNLFEKHANFMIGGKCHAVWCGIV